jgi:hypothetical protein
MLELNLTQEGERPGHGAFALSLVVFRYFFKQRMPFVISFLGFLFACFLCLDRLNRLNRLIRLVGVL